MSDWIEDNNEIPAKTLIGNRYLIQNVIGYGGLGRTYLALDSYRFSESCVVKEFAPRSTGRYHIQKSRELFKREAEILYQIKHSQIPKFLACFEERDRLFLVQEYVNGKTYSSLLRERQQEGKAFSEAEVINWLINLLPVLDYIHDRGIIHRDISPDNIMQPQGTALPVLIDFGVGKQWIPPDENESDSNSDTDSKPQTSFVGGMSCVGKIGYAPHEQINMGFSFPSSDLYALGVTAIVLLTGKEPTLLLDRYSLEWQWQQYTNVSESFARIVEKMLEYKPIKRYQSVQELLIHLQQLGQLETTIFIDSHTFNQQSHSSVKASKQSKQPQETKITRFSDRVDISKQKSQQLGQTQETEIIQPSSPSERQFHSSVKKPLQPSQLEETAIAQPSGSSNFEVRQQTWLNPEFIKRCQQELSACIGPMASIIIEEILAQHAPTSSQQLVEAITAAIPEPQLARKFKQRLLS
ncbi:serine/threonine protein kinase [Pleurocapsales cyanobacterium LEGE 06147]|nr:serine/threonine protein kinase [Pleurocapsales cyanobacterium LEGE 06147]